MTEEIIDLIDCPAIEYIAVGNQYFCKVNSCDCTKISTCGYKRLKQENEAYKQSEQEATEIIAELKQKNAELATENHNLRKALETIREILNVKCSIVSNAECVGIINEVLDET